MRAHDLTDFSFSKTRVDRVCDDVGHRCALADDKINVLVWDEQQPVPKELPPNFPATTSRIT